MTKGKEKDTQPVLVRLSRVLRKISDGHSLDKIAGEEECLKDALKEALKALADKIDVESGKVKLTLVIDGAARGNPGPAGAGAAILNPRGTPLAEKSEFLGKATNNEAEYNSLIMGLQLALERGFKRLHIRTDSELLANQITGKYKVKEPRLKALFAKAHKLLDQLEEWDIVSVPRAENRLADRLSNLAIDKAGE
ncbi:MAG: ribonuclease HI family protein [Candidatus Edwardsbacteria bacterium]|nr:ribonuclease HI family protein [Candidatus Edwardsbacteria bacterium]